MQRSFLSMTDPLKNLVYSKEDVIYFPTGILGFEDSREYVLSRIPEYLPFEWLMSVDQPPLRFAVINPLLFDSDYAPKMVKEQLLELRIEKPEDILLYVIVTIHENPAESTANLVGPVVINKAKRLGRQIIIDDGRYTTQEKLLRK
jgi:flagellar assembly factor FliW